MRFKRLPKSVPTKSAYDSEQMVLTPSGSFVELSRVPAVILMICAEYGINPVRVLVSSIYTPCGIFKCDCVSTMDDIVYVVTDDEQLFYVELTICPHDDIAA